jgi:hypothetical protein
MFYYFSRQFASSHAGTRLAGVECEKCGCRYYYELTRIGIGSVTTPYGLMATAAEESAKQQSAGELVERLSAEAELVPCPQCHWINSELVAGYRLSRYRWVVPLAVGIAFWGTVASLMSAAFLWYGPPADHAALPYVLIGGPGTFMAIAGLLVLGRNLLRSRILPNRNFPAAPRIPAGVPPALLLDEATETFHPVARAGVSLPSECAWFEFQIGRHRLPSCCAQCLGEASDACVWTHPITVAVQLSVPRCSVCRRKSKGEYLLAWPFAFVLSTTAGLGFLLLLRLDELIFWILGGCHVLLSLGVAAYYASVRSAPVRLRIADRSRGILKLRFRHPDYRPETVWTEPLD